MSDFFQSKSITTLQLLCDNKRMDSELIASGRKIVAVVPCSMGHYEAAIIHQLIDKLQDISFIHSIVIVLSGPGVENEKNKNHAFNSTHYRRDLITVLSARDTGKGRALKVGFNYIYQQFHNDAIVVTLDADFKSFHTDYLLKLTYPIAVLGGHFNKGYYARYSNNKLDGRLTRLLVFPLLSAMSAQDPTNDFLQWLLAFRYPLSGDVAMSSQLLPELIIADTWAYDLSLLRSVYRMQQGLDIYQTELSDNYEHLHRSVEKEGESGLMEVSQEIVAYLLSSDVRDKRQLAEDYYQFGLQFCEKYRKLALFNGLTYSKDSELSLVKRIYSQILLLE